MEEEVLQAALAVVDVSDSASAAAPSAPDASLVEQDPAKVDSVDAAAVAASGAAATAARTGEAAVDEKRAEALGLRTDETGVCAVGEPCELPCAASARSKIRKVEGLRVGGWRV